MMENVLEPSAASVRQVVLSATNRMIHMTNSIAGINISFVTLLPYWNSPTAEVTFVGSANKDISITYISYRAHALNIANMTMTIIKPISTVETQAGIAKAPPILFGSEMSPTIPVNVSAD